MYVKTNITLKWPTQTSQNKSVVKKTNWMCCYSNAMTNWNSSTFNLAVLSNYTKNLWKLTTLIFGKFSENGFWNNKRFLDFKITGRLGKLYKFSVSQILIQTCN